MLSHSSPPPAALWIEFASPNVILALSSDGAPPLRCYQAVFSPRSSLTFSEEFKAHFGIYPSWNQVHILLDEEGVGAHLWVSDKSEESASSIGSDLSRFLEWTGRYLIHQMNDGVGEIEMEGQRSREVVCWKKKEALRQFPELFLPSHSHEGYSRHKI